MKAVPPRRGPGRPPKTRPVAPPPPPLVVTPPPGLVDDFDNEETAFEEIAEVLSTLPPDGDVLVYRLPATGGKRETLGEVDTATFTVNFLAQKWGAGRYYLTFRAPNAEYGGRRTVVTNKMVVIGEGHLAIKPAVPTTGPVAAAPSSTVVQQALEGGLLNLIAATSKMLQSAGANNNGGDLKDVLLEMAKQRAEDQRHMLSLVIEMQKGRASSVDPMEMALKLAQMMKGGQSSLSEMKDLFGLVLEVTEGTGGKGGGEPDDLMTTAAKGFMRILEGLLARGQLGGATPAPTPPAPQLLSGPPGATAPNAGAAPAPGAPPSTSPPPATPEMMQQFLAQFMGKALEFAKQKRDPRVYAAVMFDALESYPVQVRQVAAAMLAETEGGNPEAPFTAEPKLHAAFPDMLAHAEFFTEFLEELRIKFGILTEDDDDGGGVIPPGSSGGGDDDDGFGDSYSAPPGVPTA